MFASSEVFLLASAQNSGGKRIVSPYISSATDTCKSSRYAALKPRRTVGSVSLQRSTARHLIAAFNWRWKRNTMPFAAGWYAVVLICRVPIISFTRRNNCDLNSLPWSVVTRTGVPNRATQLQRMFSQLSRWSSMFSIGNTLGLRVHLSTHVRQYLCPREIGNGPTRSICRCSNLADGVKEVAVRLITSLVTLVRWHCTQLLALSRQSQSIDGQKKHFLTSFAVVLIPGCTKSCFAS